MHVILEYLKQHGERLDSEIASDMGISLEDTCQQLAEMAAHGDVIMCRTTRYIDGEMVEGMLYRPSGYVPLASPGRKPKTPT